MGGLSPCERAEEGCGRHLVCRFCDGEGGEEGAGEIERAAVGGGHGEGTVKERECDK